MADGGWWMVQGVADRTYQSKWLCVATEINLLFGGERSGGSENAGRKKTVAGGAHLSFPFDRTFTV